MWGDPPEDSEDAIFCARVADFDRTRAVLDVGDEPTIRALSPRKRSGRLLQPGDLLLEKSGGGEKQPVGFVVLVESLPGDTICSNFIARMPVADDADPRFVRYLHQYFYSRRVNTRSIKQSTGIQNLDAHSYLQELAPRPPLPIQQAIAAFLDRETARIDTLIEKKRRLLDLLEEKRTALITRAVTRGLDPNVSMKDSGVEWIGEIPEHWEVTNAKAMFELHRGFDLPESERGDGAIPVVSSGGVVGSHDRPRVQGPGVVTGRYGSVGSVYYIDGAFWPLNTALYVRRFRGNCPRYIFYLLQLLPVLKYAAKSAVPGVDRKDVHEERIPYPPLKEQIAISEHLRNVEFDLAAIRDRIRTATSLLQEYRAALISAAVTGKIDVTEAALTPA